uniref:Uncharacterized protein n=1 Tax=Triticum urartu TaxID=4572 RepID=A0A8R7TY54_TRIUA
MAALLAHARTDGREPALTGRGTSIDHNRCAGHDTYCMNSSSRSSAAIVSGARHTSMSTLPSPERPGNADILPSNLLARPLRTARGRPHPKSLPSYIGNRLELPIVTTAPSGLPSGKHRGAACHPAAAPRIASSPYAARLAFSLDAAHRRSLDASSATVAVVGALWMAFPK